MKKLLAILTFLLAPTLAFGATYVGNITASGVTCKTTQACVTATLDNTPGFADASATITLSGTFVATLQYEVSADGGQTFTSVGSATAPGATTVAVAANQILQVRASSYTSGTVAVTILTSTAAISGSTGAMTLISQQVVSTPSSTITFSGIPGSHSDLMLTIRGSGADSGLLTNMGIQFNGDVAADYDYTFASGSGTTVSAFSASAVTNMYAGSLPGATATAGSSGQAVVYIVGYAGTSLDKNLTVDNGWLETQGTTTTYFKRGVFGQWRSTAAITSVTVLNQSGSNFNAGTRFTLYALN